MQRVQRLIYKKNSSTVNLPQQSKNISTRNKIRYLGIAHLKCFVMLLVREHLDFLSAENMQKRLSFNTLKELRCLWLPICGSQTKLL